MIAEFFTHKSFVTFVAKNLQIPNLCLYMCQAITCQKSPTTGSARSVVKVIPQRISSTNTSRDILKKTGDFFHPKQSLII